MFFNHLNVLKKDVSVVDGHNIGVDCIIICIHIVPMNQIGQKYYGNQKQEADLS